MLHKLQKTYADQPVRFILVPCNQFAHQEPKSNADVKAFAEQYVTLGAGSNVIMLAKSNLNGVPCAATGEGVCTSASKECCPANDPVYQYLQSAPALGTIGWNYDKIIVDGSGKPFAGETLLVGADVAPALDVIISRLLDTSLSQLNIAAPPISSNFPLLLLVLAMSVLAAVSAKALRSWQAKRASDQYEILLG